MKHIIQLIIFLGIAEGEIELIAMFLAWNLNNLGWENPAYVKWGMAVKLYPGVYIITGAALCRFTSKLSRVIL